MTPTPSPEQSILAFLDGKTVPAEGKSVSAFSLYWLYSRHARLAPPFRTVSTKKFGSSAEFVGRKPSSRHGG
jgi:hypothetical protein